MLVKIAKNQGFTLIELALVIMIIGLLIGGLLGPLSAKMEQQNRSQTEDYMDEVRDSLIGFSIINGRLPCPDCPDNSVGACAGGTANDGIEDMYSSPSGDLICRTSVGNTSIGNVPWVDLQVGQYDAWRRHLTYAVETDFADEVDGTSSPSCGDTVTPGVSFEICATSDISIFNAYDAAGSSGYGGTPTVAGNVPAVLISHGKNTYETNQSDVEIENYGRNPVNPETGTTILGSYTASDYKDNVFVLKNYDGEGDDAFDDIVVWLSSNVFMSRMILAGKLP